jgi:glycerol uptake facilitator-like aquaporin
MKTFRPCLAEFLGTFYLCFAGIGAILSNTPAVGGMSGLLGIALAHGLALSIAVNVFGGESGAHSIPR